MYEVRLSLVLVASKGWIRGLSKKINMPAPPVPGMKILYNDNGDEFHCNEVVWNDVDRRYEANCFDSLTDCKDATTEGGLQDIVDYYRSTGWEVEILREGQGGVHVVPHVDA
jgi:hypothetical protein